MPGFAVNLAMRAVNANHLSRGCGQKFGNLRPVPVQDIARKRTGSNDRSYQDRGQYQSDSEDSKFLAFARSCQLVHFQPFLASFPFRDKEGYCVVKESNSRVFMDSLPAVQITPKLGQLDPRRLKLRNRV